MRSSTIQPLNPEVEPCPEGMAILMGRPSLFFRALILTLTALMLGGVAWAFVGHGEVMVQAPGKLASESEERLIYAPIEGTLDQLFVVEGTPVRKGDLLARLNAPAAMQLLGQIESAKLKLRVAQATYEAYPIQREAAERYIAVHRYQIETTERIRRTRETEWRNKLAEEQRVKFDKATVNTRTAENEMNYAQADWQRHQRLYDANAGISREKVAQKHNDYLSKRALWEKAKVELAEFEISLKGEYAKILKEIEGHTESILSMRAQLAEREAALASGEAQAAAQVEMARAELDSLMSIASADIENIDPNNRLQIKSPVGGIVTSIGNVQPGAKIEPKTPFISIAPNDARTILSIEIPERERGLLREGMAVKVKFNAFSYQRYGFINGELDYIAPSASYSEVSTGNQRPLIFKGRVRLEKLSFKLPGEEQSIPLRFGMTAIAEIIVNNRRLIDFALNPLASL